MRFPRWIPYPSCWLRTLISVISIALAITLISFPFLLLGSIAGIVAFLTGGIGAVMAVPVFGGAIAGSLFLHAHSRQLVMVICKSIRKESISWSWNPPKRLWNESLIDYLVLFCGGLLAVLFVSLLIPDSYIWQDTRNNVGSILMLVFSAYGHQVRYLVREYFENKRKRKNKQANKSQLPRAKRPARAVEDSDRELNQLRWQQRQERKQTKDPVDDELDRLRREMEDKD